ncbi:hypothetical protein [Halopseudomonas bauzanensis]|uniref:hypothetical protein n=1 Tax=Halopseudomonas bauzanensis TaxID=653930 RepID=UPI003DA70DB7
MPDIQGVYSQFSICPSPIKEEAGWPHMLCSYNHTRHHKGQEYTATSALVTPFPSRERGRGRGGTTHRLKYHRQNLFGIEQYLVIPEPQNPKALLSQPCIPLGIMLAGVVLTTIGFNNQPRTEMHKIHYITAKRLLTAKLLFRQPVAAQMTPEQLLGTGHVAAQVFGEVFLVHADLPCHQVMTGVCIAASLASHG